MIAREYQCEQGHRKWYKGDTPQERTCPVCHVASKVTGRYVDTTAVMPEEDGRYSVPRPTKHDPKQTTPESSHSYRIHLATQTLTELFKTPFDGLVDLEERA